MKRWEYKEHKVPENIMNQLKNGSTLTEAGFFVWINSLCDDGWKWRTVDFPFVIMERENDSP